MKDETEKLLKKAANVKNVYDKDEDRVEQATTWDKADDLEAKRVEINQLEQQLQAPPWAGISDDARRTFTKRRGLLERELRKITPPELDADARDEFAKRVRVLDGEIADGMPQHEVMRRNPAGAVDWHKKWELHNKDLILERKNLIRALNPGNTDKDIANVELLRKSLFTKGEDSTVMVNAQIPGKFAYHNVPDRNWEGTFGEQETKGALGEVERSEKRGKLSPEELKKVKQNSAAKARAARQVKIAAKAAEGV